jgi:hypothetical protein
VLGDAVEARGVPGVATEIGQGVPDVFEVDFFWPRVERKELPSAERFDPWAAARGGAASRVTYQNR